MFVKGFKIEDQLLYDKKNNEVRDIVVSLTSIQRKRGERERGKRERDRERGERKGGKGKR